MSAEAARAELSLKEKADAVDKLPLTYDQKYSLNMLLSGTRLACSIHTEQPLPDLSEIGLSTELVTFEVEPLNPTQIEAAIRKKLNLHGQIQSEPQYIYQYFISIDPQIARLLREAFEEKNHDFIRKMVELRVLPPDRTRN